MFYVNPFSFLTLCSDRPEVNPTLFLLNMETQVTDQVRPDLSDDKP